MTDEASDVSSVTLDRDMALTADGSSGGASLVDSEGTGEAMTVFKAYDPRDLIVSWMKRSPSDVEGSNLPESTPPKRNQEQKTVQQQSLYVIVVSATVIIFSLAVIVVAIVARSGDSSSAQTAPPLPWTFQPSAVSPETIGPAAMQPSSMVAPETSEPSTMESSTLHPSASPSMVPSTTIRSAFPTIVLVTIGTGTQMSSPAEELKKLLSSVSYDAGLALSDDSSPQFSAFSWLATNPLSKYSTQRKIQRYVLATLYFSSGGDMWAYDNDWLTNSHECDWRFGPSSVDPCGSNEEIFQIVLNENNLVGTMPPELAMLSHSLEILILSRNELYGPVPSEIGLLTSMQTMDISSNSLSGHLTSEICGLGLSELILDCTEIECSCCSLCK